MTAELHEKAALARGVATLASIPKLVYWKVQRNWAAGLMKLTYFSIENYRSISRATFHDISNVAILIGPNNEGKSNILHGLNTCLQLLGSDRVLFHRIQAEGEKESVRIRYERGSYDWESDYPIARQLKYPAGQSTFELHFSLTNEEQSVFFESTGSRLNDVAY